MTDDASTERECLNCGKEVESGLVCDRDCHMEFYYGSGDDEGEKPVNFRNTRGREIGIQLSDEKRSPVPDAWLATFDDGEENASRYSHLKFQEAEGNPPVKVVDEMPLFGAPTIKEILEEEVPRLVRLWFEENEDLGEYPVRRDEINMFQSFLRKRLTEVFNQ